MSDGGISMAAAWGYNTNELARSVLVRPDWLKRLREDRIQLENTVRSVIHQWTSQKAAYPELPEDLAPILKRIAQGEHKIFGEWSYDEDKCVDAIYVFNKQVDRAWNYGLGFGDKEPRKAQERRKAGYTKTLTPKGWLAVRDEMVKFTIAKAAYTNEIWRDEVEVFMDFLREGKLPEGIAMDKNRPKLRPAVANNILWFLQQGLGWVNNDEIDVCSDCGKILMTDRETHDWCPTCGKMRCESCTTAPYDCQCEHPCSRHCTCKKHEND